jgi:predicted metal-dependent hydrolase
MNLPPQLLRSAGEPIELACRVNRRARSIALKVDHATGRAVLVLPSKRSLREGLRFAETQVEWLRRHLANVEAPLPFADGATVPCDGRLLRIAALPGLRRELLAGDVLHVPAEDPVLTGMRVRRWLKLRAGERLRERVAAHARTLRVKHGRVSVRDQRTRWGSCSSEGDLAFSWRLILAPPAVLDYVVAHEVAHIVELNHSKAFWKQVARLMPDYARHRDWLRDHGQALHRYG